MAKMRVVDEEGEGGEDGEICSQSKGPAAASTDGRDEHEPNQHKTYEVMASSSQPTRYQSQGAKQLLPTKAMRNLHVVEFDVKPKSALLMLRQVVGATGLGDSLPLVRPRSRMFRVASRES
jgi:hypothetical protein